jgi:hypothetical protein
VKVEEETFNVVFVNEKKNSFVFKNPIFNNVPVEPCDKIYSLTLTREREYH